MFNYKMNYTDCQREVKSVLEILDLIHVRFSGVCFYVRFSGVCRPVGKYSYIYIGLYMNR